MQISTVDLRYALGLASRYVPSRTAMPILSHVNLTLEDGVFSVSASNLSAHIRVYTKVDSNETFNVTVPAKPFVDLINKVRDDVVVMTVNDETATTTIRYGGSRTTFRGILGDEFPHMRMDFDTNFTLEGKFFSRIVELTSFAAIKDGSHPVLGGILLSCDKGTLFAASSDGFRGSLFETEAPTDTPNFSCIIPAPALISLTIPDETIRFGVSDGVMGITTSTFAFTTQLISGTFPDIQRIVPASQPLEITVETEELKRAIETAMIFARDAGNLVKMDINGETITVSARTAENGDTDNKVSLAYSNVEAESEFQIGVNGAFLLDVLKIAPAMSTLGFDAPTKPIKITFTESIAFKHVIMPMHIVK